MDDYVDGVRLVELAALSDPALVARAVAGAVGVREEPGRPLVETLSDALQPKEMLLVLDNCEHLVEPCAELANALLRAAPHLRILATSREALGTAGEAVWRVPPLTVPPPSATPRADELVRYDAVKLFLDRARASHPGFEFTPEDASAVLRICRRLDGAPLAIELAAARVKVMSAEEIGNRLDDALSLLRAGNRAALPRHRTLRAALDWSYDLLSEPERALLGRLSVFVSGWSLEAAEAVCSRDGIGRGEVLGVLSGLVDKSLVIADGRDCYRLLETVRQYAGEKLEGSGEADVVRRRHAEYYLSLVQRADEGLRGPDQAAWVERMEREHPNLRAAIEWSLQAEPETALGLAGPLGHFWYAHGHIAEGREWLESTLERTAGIETAERARALQNVGVLSEKCGMYDRAVQSYEQALALWRRLGNERRVAGSLMNLGAVAYAAADLGRARERTEEALARYREIEDRRGMEMALSNLAEIAHAGGDLARAGDLMEESLALTRESGDPRDIAVGLLNLGALEVERGEADRAEPRLQDALQTFQRIHDTDSVVETLQALAGAAGVRGGSGRAATLLGAVQSAREKLGTPVDPVERARYERLLASSQCGLAREAWAAAWDAGRAMSLDEATEYALSPSPKPPHRSDDRSTGPGAKASLTRREREMAALVARGLTNQQIAQELGISERTADKHITNILGKLGLRSRAEISARAIEWGLLPVREG